MGGREPIVTKKLGASEAQQQFSEVLDQVRRGEARVLVEKSGIPVAGIISARDFALFNQYLERREEDFAILDEIGEAFKGVPAEEIEREVGRALTAVRKKMRAERVRTARPA
jgi:prevent-host-death family protein